MKRGPRIWRWLPALALSLRLLPAQTNGIIVGAPKTYDDRGLQILLDAARAKLAGLQSIDSTSIMSRIGSQQGASYSQTGISVNAGGPPIPGVATTAQTGNSVNTQAAGSTGTANTSNNQTVLTGPSTQTVTTQAPLTAAAPALPANTGFTLPSSFSTSASTAFNEQLQLTYEIAGYEMMLEGALSDRYTRIMVKGAPQQFVRRRTTIEIPIEIRNPKEYENAVAEVVVTASTNSPYDANAAPVVTAILPTEKSYNVAAITDRTASIGGGIVTGVMSAGATLLFGHKTYYVIQDQDTIALQPSDQSRTATSFGWQFRPVLGRKIVQPGMRHVFVQLAFPNLPDTADFGSVTVATRWRKFDRKTGVISPEPIAGSTSTDALSFDLPHFDLTPPVGVQKLEDNGDGTITISVQGDFLPGAWIRSGGQALSGGGANVLFDPSGVRFVAPALQVALSPIYLVARSGEEVPILDPTEAAPRPPFATAPASTPPIPDTADAKQPATGAANQAKCLQIGKSQVRFLDATSALVTVSLAFNPASDCRLGGFTPENLPNLVVVAANKVFGLRDAPFQSRSASALSFVAPAALLRGAPRVTVARLLFGERFAASQTLDLSAAPSIDKAVLVSQTRTEVKVALLGGNLADLALLTADGLAMQPLSDTTLLITTSPDKLAGLKQLVLRRASGEVLVAALPALDAATTPPPAPKPKLEAHAPVKAGASMTIDIAGTDLASLDHVEYMGHKLVSHLKDNQTVTVELPTEAVGKAGTPQLDFIFKTTDRVSYPLSVFDTKIDIPK